MGQLDLQEQPYTLIQKMLTVDREELSPKEGIADGVRVYHRNPITLELSFEK